MNQDLDFCRGGKIRRIMDETFRYKSFFFIIFKVQIVNSKMLFFDENTWNSFFLQNSFTNFHILSASVYGVFFALGLWFLWIRLSNGLNKLESYGINSST